MNENASPLLSWTQVRALVPLSRGTVWALRRKGDFPQPVRISSNRIAWRLSDVNEWIENRPKGVQ